jgi:hypothetical protein
MTTVPITKIQILADRDTKHPLFYCHSSDRDHNPLLTISRKDRSVEIRAKKMLFKVKSNPQRKNRVDIYMSIAEAHALGNALMQASDGATSKGFPESNSNPAAAAKGNMQLPTIIWSRCGRCRRAGAQVRTGTKLRRDDGYVHVDLEYPDDTHIKMKDYEIHLGFPLKAPTGTHDIGEAIPVHVPEKELQRGRNEQNPLNKTIGDFYLELSEEVAAGLGKLLAEVQAPKQPTLA